MHILFCLCQTQIKVYSLGHATEKQQLFFLIKSALQAVACVRS